MNSHLFQALPIGTLFFRDPFNESENPSIKVDDTHARNPRGAVVEVNGGVLVFTGAKIKADKPIPVSIPAFIPAGNDLRLLNDLQLYETLEPSLEIA